MNRANALRWLSMSYRLIPTPMAMLYGFSLLLKPIAIIVAVILVSTSYDETNLILLLDDKLQGHSMLARIAALYGIVLATATVITCYYKFVPWRVRSDIARTVLAALLLGLVYIVIRYQNEIAQLIRFASAILQS